MPYKPLRMGQEERIVTHLLDSWYEPETIEKLKDKLFVEENPKQNEITLIMNQWKNSSFGRIIRRESVVVTPSFVESLYKPKSATIYYGPLRDEKTKERMKNLLNNFVRETNESVGFEAVKIKQDPYGITMGFEVNGGWEGVICYIRKLEKEIYGPNTKFELYGMD